LISGAGLCHCFTSFCYLVFLLAAHHDAERVIFQRPLQRLASSHRATWARTASMDVIVTPAEGGTVWQLTDLLGRSMGRLTASAPRQLMIHPEGHALETMAGIQQGPHASLDAALAEIERHTRGVCRRNPGEDQL